MFNRIVNISRKLLPAALPIAVVACSSDTTQKTVDFCAKISSDRYDAFLHIGLGCAVGGIVGGIGGKFISRGWAPAFAAAGILIGGALTTGYYSPTLLESQELANQCTRQDYQRLRLEAPTPSAQPR